MSICLTNDGAHENIEHSKSKSEQAMLRTHAFMPKKKKKRENKNAAHTCVHAYKRTLTHMYTHTHTLMCLPYISALYRHGNLPFHGPTRKEAQRALYVSALYVCLICRPYIRTDIYHSTGLLARRHNVPYMCLPYRCLPYMSALNRYGHLPFHGPTRKEAQQQTFAKLQQQLLVCTQALEQTRCVCVCVCVVRVCTYIHAHTHHTHTHTHTHACMHAYTCIHTRAHTICRIICINACMCICTHTHTHTHAHTHTQRHIHILSGALPSH